MSAPPSPILLSARVFAEENSPEEVAKPVSPLLSPFKDWSKIFPKFRHPRSRDSRNLKARRVSLGSSESTFDQAFPKPSPSMVGLGFVRPKLMRSWDTLETGTSTFGESASMQSVKGGLAQVITEHAPIAMTASAEDSNKSKHDGQDWKQKLRQLEWHNPTPLSFSLRLSRSYPRDINCLQTNSKGNRQEAQEMLSRMKRHSMQLMDSSSGSTEALSERG